MTQPEGVGNRPQDRGLPSWTEVRTSSLVTGSGLEVEQGVLAGAVSLPLRNVGSGEHKDCRGGGCSSELLMDQETK